jgi:hypothetical protein
MRADWVGTWDLGLGGGKDARQSRHGDYTYCPERKKATEVATPRGKDFPPACRLPETSVRERGTPPRSRALASKLGLPVGASGIGGRHGGIEGVQVSSSPSLERRIWAFQTKGERSRTRYPDEEEDEI